MCDQIEPSGVCECMCVHVCRNERLRLFPANDRRSRQNFERIQEKTEKYRHSRQTVLASLPLALNVSCTQRMQGNAIYHLFAPHIAKNYSWEFVIMWRRHFPVHSPRTIFMFWLSFLQPSAVKKHIWHLDHSLHINIFALLFRLSVQSCVVRL